MRQTRRLLASIKPVRYLEVGAPTGLTGLLTYQSPRPTLLFLYSSTLDKLKEIPESSVYRQSVEALTKQRLSIIESVKPAGYDEWLVKAREKVDKHPDFFTEAFRKTADGSPAAGIERDGKFFVVRQPKSDVDVRVLEWEDEPVVDIDLDIGLEGDQVAAERQGQQEILQTVLQDAQSEGESFAWVDEPALTADQIEELENKIGAGLIEEVIQVAKGELQLVDTMVQAKVWETLDEKPQEGQWEYFDRRV